MIFRKGHMESIDGLATIRLTKNNRQKILDINDGFTAESFYNLKRGGSYIREYKISNGKLVIRDMLRNTTNENQDDKSWIATDAAVLFLIFFSDIYIDCGLSPRVKLPV